MLSFAVASCEFLKLLHQFQCMLPVSVFWHTAFCKRLWILSQPKMFNVKWKLHAHTDAKRKSWGIRRVRSCIFNAKTQTLPTIAIMHMIYLWMLAHSTTILGLGIHDYFIVYETFPHWMVSLYHSHSNILIYIEFHNIVGINEIDEFILCMLYFHPRAEYKIDSKESNLLSMITATTKHIC